MVRVRRWALARPRVLLVDAPGVGALRWSVEAELDRRRWPIALSPADTDLLLVLGTPGPELAAAIDVIWTQVPRPGHRQEMAGGEPIGPALDLAVAALVEIASDRGASLDERVSPVDLLAQAPADLADHGGGGHEGHDMSSMAAPMGDGGGGHGGHDMSSMAAPMGDGGGGHGGHDMHHGGAVAGLAMAMTVPDRDGLVLDSLQVSLGPVLPGWPTGLVVRAGLHGDVLTGVEASWLDESPHSGLDGHRPHDAKQLALDGLARFLVVAGWPAAARDARLARDGLGSADPAAVTDGRRRAARLVRRLRRSRTLAWSVRGMGRVPDPMPAKQRHDDADDVIDRVLRWCDVIDERPHVRTVPSLPPSGLTSLLEGAELAAARLVVASVTVEPVPAHADDATAAHG